MAILHMPTGLRVRYGSERSQHKNKQTALSSEKPPKRLVIHSNAARDKTRPPQTQLVGWKRYLEVVTTKGFYYSIATVCVGSGVLLGLLSLLIFLVEVMTWQDGENNFGVVMMGTLLAAMGIAAIWAGNAVGSNAQKMDRVQLITREDTYLLPVRTTLVRAANPPASEPRTELLRATGLGPETPTEQLLRAGEEDR